MAATTSSKNVLFGLGHNYTAAQYRLAIDAALHWIPADQGLEIGGTPVGSYAFMTNFVNKTGDGILRELDQLQAFVEGPNGTMRASTQTIYTSAVLNNLLTFFAPAHLLQLFMPLVGSILP